MNQTFWLSIKKLNLMRKAGVHFRYESIQQYTYTIDRMTIISMAIPYTNQIYFYFLECKQQQQKERKIIYLIK